MRYAAAMGLKALSREDRLRLVRFVCSYVWADLRVDQAERDFVARLVRRLGLDAEERAQVDAWLQVPPPPEEVDPAEVPPRHRRLFLEEVRAVVEADGEIAEEERENLRLLEELFGAS